MWKEYMIMNIVMLRKNIFLLLCFVIPFVAIAIAKSDQTKAVSTLPSLVDQQDEALQECKNMIIGAPIPTVGISINDKQKLSKLRTRLRNIFVDTYAKVACNPLAASTITQEFLSQKKNEINRYYSFYKIIRVPLLT